MILVHQLRATRFTRNKVFAILAKNDSTMFSQEPCLGVKVNSKRFGNVARECARLFANVRGVVV